MNYMIITNNNKVFNFYKETNEVIYLKDSTIKDLLIYIDKKCREGHRLLSDPILYNLDNSENPFKSILISKEKLEDNSPSIKMSKVTLTIADKISFTPKANLTDIQLEEFRYVDLNLLIDSIKHYDFL